MDEALELEDIDAAYCLLFLREVRDAAFATVDEEGLPAVRVIDVMMVEDGRLYFVAARGKAFCADIMRTRYVAIVGQSQDFRTCRLRGAVERPDDEAERHRLIDRIFELNPSLRELYPGDSRYVLEPFYLQDAQGEYFDLSGKPIVRVPFALGSLRAAVEGFVITDRCQECGACADACPEACIEEGPPYAIVQEHCLRCGLCRETCSFGAIDRRS